MSTLNGVHHLAIMTSDVKKQIEFFSDVLGMKLKALYWMHNVDGYFHAFMELNPSCSVAFVQSPEVKDIPVEMGASHAGNPTKPCAPGAMQHVAFNCDNDEELYAMRDRIRAKGVRVLGPLDHGFCKSIYFGGPENLVLEVSTSEAGINQEAWIDPEVVELNGISAEELVRYKNPPRFDHIGDPVAQPAAGTGRPEYSNMDEEFAAAFDLPDEVVTRELSETTPPVKVA
ncbi:MAG: VOC family protein [Gammaproteobacteria bacterium]|nr:VOC family protein [Gammaproteobacteria bacterium]